MIPSQEAAQDALSDAAHWGSESSETVKISELKKRHFKETIYKVWQWPTLISIRLTCIL